MYRVYGKTTALSRTGPEIDVRGDISNGRACQSTRVEDLPYVHIDYLLRRLWVFTIDQVEGKQVSMSPSLSKTTPCIVAFASLLLSAMPTDTLA